MIENGDTVTRTDRATFLGALSDGMRFLHATWFLNQSDEAREAAKAPPAPATPPEEGVRNATWMRLKIERRLAQYITVEHIANFHGGNAAACKVRFPVDTRDPYGEIAEEYFDNSTVAGAFASRVLRECLENQGYAL
ncbi:MAG: hypothetical protein ACYCT3_12075 [Acidiferrobacter sp.]